MLMSKYVKTIETVKELMEAFQVFDRDRKGCVSSSDLRLVLQQVGEKLSTEEVEEIISSAECTPGGQIYYDGKVKKRPQIGKCVWWLNAFFNSICRRS